jgi:hypothetical protein
MSSGSELVGVGTAAHTLKGSAQRRRRGSAADQHVAIGQHLKLHLGLRVQAGLVTDGLGDGDLSLAGEFHAMAFKEFLPESVRVLLVRRKPAC